MSFQVDPSIFFRGLQAQQNQQQSFFDSLSRGMAIAEQRRDRQDRQKQIELEQAEKANDPKVLANNARMKLAQGQQPAPNEIAALRAEDAVNRTKVTVDQWGNQIRNDSFFDVIGQYGLQNPSQTRAAPAPVQQDAVSAPKITNKAEEMAYGAQLDIEKEERAAKRKKEEADTKKADSQKVVKDALEKLNSLNKDLKNDGGIRSQDRGIVGNAGAYMANMPVVGDAVQSVFDPKTQSTRDEYERIRDSLIPFYIQANNLPATVVDTEEFQQRILKAFGDPSGDFESNKAALENQAFQFGVEMGGEKKKEKSRADRAREILKKRGVIK